MCLSLLHTWQGKARRCGTPTEATCCRCSSPSRVSCSSISPTTTRRGTRNRWEATRASATPRSTTSRRRERKVDAYLLRRPPAHFERLVRAHFKTRGKTILDACAAHLNGCPVGAYEPPRRRTRAGREAPQRRKSRAETLRRLREGSNSCSRNSCRNSRGVRGERTRGGGERGRGRTRVRGGMRTDDDTRATSLSEGKQTDSMSWKNILRATTPDTLTTTVYSDLA